MVSKNNQNPFDILRNFGDMADIQKFLGPDFFKNIPLPNMQNGSFFNDSARTEDKEDEFPRVDLYNRGNEIVAVIEIPGLSSSSDVALGVRPNLLSVKGTITARFNLRDDTVLLSECHHGNFEREVELPIRVIANEVKAVYRSGLLVVYLTKDKSHDGPESLVSIDFGEE
ncbi:Hsp20/alpha crystallin family protein [Alicyclobacillus dauci]|uniref:Hsp20/alpha crystallin family protein n=1 Tax=Alicyclobacillus dauci TaxID=1475485 RepID=A0ABY6YXK0_9BACL|nr:Hsp20/alpha crystallin family protein [Alicyclobacillus dauci]WAH35267.1 Hsp20/alpha crystallin family protein [Alicyclobacillus dauci]